MDIEDVTHVKNAVHNPNDPRHFMRIVPAAEPKVAVLADQKIAESSAAIVVKEVGRDIYDPVIYFPRDDVAMDLLVRTEKTTHCPLKGDTEYFDVVIGNERVPDAAWSYVEMVAGFELQDLVAFDARVITVS